jgi:hypothetical protein
VSIAQIATLEHLDLTDTMIDCLCHRPIPCTGVAALRGLPVLHTLELALWMQDTLHGLNALIGGALRRLVLTFDAQGQGDEFAPLQEESVLNLAAAPGLRDTIHALRESGVHVTTRHMCPESG